MEVLHEPCAGLDMHKRTVVACAIVSGGRPTRSFGTMTEDLWRLRGWLAELGVTHIAMEATGVYWKSLYNVLEGDFQLLVVNAQHIKALPGRKADVGDGQWIADLLRHGLLRGSFIPERQMREIRELTRTRAALVRERARVVQRLEKGLEYANIKLGTVLTYIAGVSGQRILRALIGGKGPQTLADLAHWRMQKKLAQLEAAVVSRLSEVSRFLVRQHLEHWQELERRIEAFDREVEERMRPFEARLVLLESIPGVSRRIAQVLVAEIGDELGRFPTSRHLAPWAGMCPDRAGGEAGQRGPGTGVSG